MHSLHLRLLATFIAVIAVSIATIALISHQATSTQFQRYLADNLERDWQLQGAIDTFRVTGDESQLQDQMMVIGTTYGDRVLLTGPDQRVVADSAGVLIDHRFAVPAQPALPIDGAEPIWSRTIPTFPMSMSVALMTTAPLTDQIMFMSYPAYVFRNDGIGATEAGFLGSVNRSLLLGVLAAAAASLLLTVTMSRRIVGPIEALTAAARQLANGEFRQRVAVHTKDEIGDLALAFNAMADSLLRTEDLRRNMVTDVSHELRTPLTVLSGYLEACRDGVATPSPELIDSLYEEVVLLRRLVDDLQELALAEAGQLQFDRQAVDLPALAEKTVAALGPQFQARELDVELAIPADLPPFVADVNRLGQILRNLLQNAITHTPPGGRVSLRAASLDGRIVIEVADTGNGIAEADLPFIFERFYRADHSRVRATGGAGVGLAIVKQLVEAHGGTIGAVSAPGQGATFRITLPSESRGKL